MGLVVRTEFIYGSGLSLLLMGLLIRRVCQANRPDATLASGYVIRHGGGRAPGDGAVACHAPGRRVVFRSALGLDHGDSHAWRRACESRRLALRLGVWRDDAYPAARQQVAYSPGSGLSLISRSKAASGAMLTGPHRRTDHGVPAGSYGAHDR